MTKTKSKESANRRIIYFSGKLLTPEGLQEEQTYFRKTSTDSKNPLFVIDLSEVISKYIGETEKNLGLILDKTKNLNGILVFDETDSLFDKRTKVQDSHDRYANLEVDHLLSKLENHQGIIVNSNKKASKSSIDKVDYVICMPPRKRKRKINTTK